MKMTLEEAHDCLSRDHFSPKCCTDCEVNKRPHGKYECIEKALEIGATAINYMLVGRKLGEEAEKK